MSEPTAAEKPTPDQLEAMLEEAGLGLSAPDDPPAETSNAHVQPLPYDPMDYDGTGDPLDFYDP